MSSLESWVWDTIQLFFYCYSRQPGWSGWTLQRTGYPATGAVGDQPAVLMACFEILEHEFYAIQGELSDEGRRAKELEQAHRRTQRE